MVKFIIDVETDFVPDSLLSYEDPILIINEKCFVTESQLKTLKFLSQINQEWQSGPLYVRTNSELFKGILIAKIIEKYPDASLLMNNSDRFKLNIPNLLCIKSTQSISLAQYQTLHKTDDSVHLPTSPKKNPNVLIKIVKKPYTETEVVESFPITYHLLDKMTKRTGKPVHPLSSQGYRLKSHNTLIERPGYNSAVSLQRSPDLGTTQINPLRPQQNNEFIRAPSVKFVFNPDSKSFSSNQCQKSLLLSTVPDTSMQDPLKSILTITTLSSMTTFYDLFLVVSQTIKLEPFSCNTLDRVKTLLTVLFEKKIFTFSQSNNTLEQIFQTSSFWNTSIKYNKFKNPFQYK